MQFVRIREKLDQHNKLYFQWVTTISQEEPRRYGMLAADDLTREDYDALRRQQVIDVPYQGRLYTEQEIVTGAGSRIAELTLTPSPARHLPASRVSWLCHSNDTAMHRQPSIREAFHA